MDEAPHPRQVFELRGAEAPEQAWLEALQRGRMHHAWLLVGPEGVGKATFAYRAARRLLGARPDPSNGLLGSDPDDPVSRQVAARSHPDLLVLERAGEDGKPRVGGISLEILCGLVGAAIVIALGKWLGKRKAMKSAVHEAVVEVDRPKN